MESWISNWRQKSKSSCRRSWLWLPVALLLLFTGTGWGVVNYTWKEVTLQVNDDQIVTRTFSKKVAQLLAEQKIELGSEDVVIPDLDEPIKKGMVVTVKRAIPVKIFADGKEQNILTQPATVAEILNKAEVKLNPEDRVTPALNSTVVAGESIKVTRVSTKIEKINKEIPYRVERQTDKKLEKGITRIVQKGQKGLQQETYRVVYEDGEEKSRELLDTTLIREPVTRVIAVGVLNHVSRGGQQFRFKSAFWAEATAYTHTGNRTASGTYPHVGTVAVDPRVIPMGSRLYIEGYGFGVAEDVGSAIKGKRIDVFLENEAACQRWGVRQVKVYILN
ncbi:MAG: hypothetical protein PWP31_625 [Clostridia bacterium]|nr:hypothetical protein [Clostridia bacterium]